MKIHSISIKNILGVESLEINPGAVTIISGENGSGKTSCLEAVKSIGLKGHDATLLKAGAEKGEIVFVLDDGVEISKKITADKTDTAVKHPVFGKIGKPTEYIKKLVDALSLNPIEFLTAKSEARVDLLLQAIPMTVTADQLGFVPITALTGIDLSGHALPVLAKVGKAIYDLRTGVNRAAKEKRITASQMAETLPQDAPEGNWTDALESLTGEYRELQKTTQGRISAIKSDASVAGEAARNLCAQKAQGVRDELAAAIEKLKTDAESEISRLTEGRDKELASIQSHRDEAMKAAEEEYRPKHAELSERIGQAKSMVEAHTKAETTRTHITQWNSEAEKMEVESEKLSASLDALEKLKSSLLSNLPIESMEIRDGDIYIDGINFDRVNTAKQIRLAIEVAKLRAGSLGLVAVDGLERLDAKTFAAFKKAAAKSGLQFVISHVTEGPLSISTEGDAA